MRTLIIIPAYNEEEALPRSLHELLDRPQDKDVLIVNDGSSDATARICDELVEHYARVHAVHLPVNIGIGGAVQTGLRYAEYRHYDVAVQYDADGQHDAAQIENLCRQLATQKLDMCIGSRFLAPQQGGFRSTRLRRIGIRFFSTLIGMLSNVTVTDPTSGFRAYGKRAISLFAQDYPDDYPEPEAVFVCGRNGLLVGEVAVSMRTRQGGVSSIRYLASAYYMIKVTIAILIDRLRRKENINDS